MKGKIVRSRVTPEHMNRARNGSIRNDNLLAKTYKTTLHLFIVKVNVFEKGLYQHQESHTINILSLIKNSWKTGFQKSPDLSKASL